MGEYAEDGYGMDMVDMVCLLPVGYGAWRIVCPPFHDENTTLAQIYTRETQVREVGAAGKISHFQPEGPRFSSRLGQGLNFG